MGRKKTPPDDYHALAEKRGFHWLGPEVPTTHTKTGWECEQGHQWKTTFQSIRRGTGCPFCVGQAPKTLDDYHTLAKERGFRWLGPEVPNTNTKTGWECEQDHQWKTTFQSIQQGKSCPFCSGRATRTPDDYHMLAKERGFCWLGPEVPNTNTKTGWECEQGHQWKTTFQSIRRRIGCPFCAGQAPKTPDDYHTLAKERGFRWLGSEVPNIRTKTGWECEQGHQWKTTFQSIQRGIGCPFCFGNAPKMPDDYYILAKERGFKWLGPQVPNIKTRTSWECEQGHQWETRYNAIQKGRGCPFCARNQKTPID